MTSLTNYPGKRRCCPGSGRGPETGVPCSLRCAQPAISNRTIIAVGVISKAPASRYTAAQPDQGAFGIFCLNKSVGESRYEAYASA